MITFSQATDDYERWLAVAIPGGLVATDLRHKHDVFADPFPFFRGTYYRWAQHWATSPLAGAPRVLAVGDLHVENFGTWRDREGRLCWGVNDFDEADELAYTNDLVRLAASARVAHRAGELDVALEDACAAILDGYRECLATAGGQPFVLEEHSPNLRALATSADRDPKEFWDKMARETEPPASPLPADARQALIDDLPAPDLNADYRARPGAGVGSLGRPRFVALAPWQGSLVCREAKAAAPPATAWAAGTAGACRLTEVVGGAARAPDPFYRLAGRWVVRRLGPKSSRIKLDKSKAVDVGRVLHAMGAETANVHHGTAAAVPAVLKDLDGRPKKWLEQNARALADRMEEDRAEWVRLHPPA